MFFLKYMLDTITGTPRNLYDSNISEIYYHSSKTKEYISDVLQKIIELHKLESGFKKRARAVKIPIFTIRAIIKKFQSTYNVTKLPGRGHVSISS